MKIGDRVQLLCPLHPKGKQLVLVACMDAKGDASGECGLPNLRGTVTGVGIVIDEGLKLLVRLDANDREIRVPERSVRLLDPVELLAELA